MPYARSSIDTFATARQIYANATVSFYTVDDDGDRTETLATLYAGVSGSTLLPNPQTLDAFGKFDVPVYIDVPVIAVVEPTTELPTEEETGIISNYGRWRGIFALSTRYYANDIFQDPVTGNMYAALKTFTSTQNVAGHLADGDIELALELTVEGLISPAMYPVTSAATVALARNNLGVYGTSDVYTKAETDTAISNYAYSKAETNNLINGGSHGGCRISYSSPTALAISPYNGNKLIINGSLEEVVSDTVSNDTLLANTLYYVYAYLDTTVKIECSTTSFLDDSSGVKVKNGDVTRTLVGMIYTNGSSEFSSANGDIANWFNRKPVVVSSSFTIDRSTTSTTLTEINSEIRCNFLSWGDGVTTSFSGAVSGATVGMFIDTTISNGSTNIGGTRHTIGQGAGTGGDSSFNKSYQAPLGRSYVTIFGKTNNASYTATWISDAGGVAGSGKLDLVVNI